MKKSREIFFEYLDIIGFSADSVRIMFEKYFHELVDINQKINLFSRNTPIDEIWTRFFLDSIGIFEVCRDWDGKNVLDFGSGGGFPGIPIKILAPSCYMTLLDSTGKKIDALMRISENIHLKEMSFLKHRIEGIEMVAYKNMYDIIVCRAVKITPDIVKSLKTLLCKDGKIFLYKSNNFDDVKLFTKYNVYKLDIEKFGNRNIIEINNG